MGRKDLPMKQSLLTAALFLLAGSLASPAQQTGYAADTETAKTAASHGEKSDPSKHHSDRDAKKKEKTRDKMKKAPSREEQEYDPTKGMWG
jgi:hypothetical protein